MQVQINNETTFKLPSHLPDAVRFVCQHLCVEHGEFELSFVKPDTIQDLNQRYFNASYLTDVIAFNLGTLTEPHGDIYICPKKAHDNANDYDVSIDRELYLLVIHGVLHVFGYEDTTPKKKAKMHRLQNTLLDDFLCQLENPSTPNA